MSSPVRAVAFDLDGTLVDSRTAVVEAVATGCAEVLARHGASFRPTHDAITGGMGLPSDEYYARLLPPELQSLAAAVKAAATDHEVSALAEGRGRLYPNVAVALQQLRKRGWKLAAISNAQEPYFRAALEYLELAPLFDHCECYEEMPPTTGPSKQALLTRALEALGTPAGDTAMVGDRGDDIDAGRALGCVTVGLRQGFGTLEELVRAHFVVDTAAEVPALDLFGLID